MLRADLIRHSFAEKISEFVVGIPPRIGMHYYLATHETSDPIAHGPDFGNWLTISGHDDLSPPSARRSSSDKRALASSAETVMDTIHFQSIVNDNHEAMSGSFAVMSAIRAANVSSSSNCLMAARSSADTFGRTYGTTDSCAWRRWCSARIRRSSGVSFVAPMNAFYGRTALSGRGGGQGGAE
jgi:hypothetical protein